MAGIAEDFIDTVFLHNFSYATRVTPSQGLRIFVARVENQANAFAILWLLAAIGLALPLSGSGDDDRASSRRGRWLLGAWLAASLVGTSVGLYFRPHYFIQLLPALCALAAFPLAWSCERAWRRGPLIGGTAILASALLILVLPTYDQRNTLRAATPADISTQIYGANPFPESLVIAEYIRRNSEPSDSVFIVGSEPQILFYSGRRSATRYILFYPLTGDYEGVLDVQASVVAEVEESNPKFILRINLYASHFNRDYSETLVYDAAHELATTDYDLAMAGYVQEGAYRYTMLFGSFAESWLARAASTSSPQLHESFMLYRRR